MDSLITIDSHYAGLDSVASVFLIHENSRAVLVETNTTHAVPRILARMETLSVPKTNLDYVIVTHVHLDHAGGTWAVLEECPNAVVLAHPKTAKHLINPELLIKSSKNVYGDKMFDSLYGEIRPIPKERVRIMEDGETISWADHTFQFIYTKGHANHHFCIYDSKLNGVFTGDSFGISYPHLENGKRFIFPTTTPTDFDADEAIVSIQKILNTGAKSAYLTHFGEIQNLESNAEDLKIGIELSRSVLHALVSIPKSERLVFAETKVKEMIQTLANRNSLQLTPKDWKLLDLDVNLNAQGLVYAFERSNSKMD